MTRQIIVVVDDEPHIRHIIGRKLEGAGYEVHTAADGDEGLELVRNLRPCLLVTDLQMPGMSGLELSAACRENPRTRRIPIILVTGSVITTTDIRAKSEVLGNICCISKPFSPRKLLQKARELVEGQTPE
jgi:CheY-like chemotaxis protein